ncbi:MAG: hypothetical protein ABEJ05_09660 [Haloglomus sp.]
MPYFECEECGQMADLQRFEQSRIRQPCPVCEESTVWTTAFEADEEVTF